MLVQQVPVAACTHRARRLDDKLAETLSNWLDPSRLVWPRRTPVPLILARRFGRPAVLARWLWQCRKARDLAVKLLAVSVIGASGCHEALGAATAAAHRQGARLVRLHEVFPKLHRSLLVPGVHLRISYFLFLLSLFICLSYLRNHGAAVEKYGSRYMYTRLSKRSKQTHV